MSLIVPSLSSNTGVAVDKLTPRKIAKSCRMQVMKHPLNKDVVSLPHEWMAVLSYFLQP